MFCSPHQAHAHGHNLKFPLLVQHLVKAFVNVLTEFGIENKVSMYKTCSRGMTTYQKKMLCDAGVECHL